MKKNLFFILFVVPFFVFCQSHEANNWVFGKKAGIDFSTNPPEISFPLILTQEGCAAISDSVGSLLFYTDGVQIWDKTHGIMHNGIALNGHFSSTQSALIIPKPNDYNLYYIFTTPYQGEPAGLQYSVVDISLENGLGSVIEKNIPLVTPVAEKLTAVNHQNGRDIWVITHGWETMEVIGSDTIYHPSDAFFAYLLTPEGVNHEAVISNCGSMLGGHTLNTVGYMKASPDGKKLALAHYMDEKYELFHFDDETGMVSNAVVFEGYEKAYGLDFSPNSKILYISRENNMNIQLMDIYQVDIYGTYTDTINAINHIGFVSNYAAIGRGALQVAPDFSIYIARGENNWLGKITYPNVWGDYCELENNGLWLESNTAHISKYGLPNFNQSYFDQSGSGSNSLNFIYNQYCAEEATNFFIVSDISGNDSLLWDFGDGSYSIENYPTHVYTEAGNYDIRLKVWYENYSEDTLKTINIFKVIANAGSDTSILFDTPAQLKGSVLGGIEPYKTEWQPSNLVDNHSSLRTSTKDLQIPTQFILKTTDSNKCENTDTVMVEIWGGPLLVNAYASIDTLCPGDSNQLFAYVSGGSENYTYDWYTIPPGFHSEIWNPVIFPDISENYYLRVFDGYHYQNDTVDINIISSFPKICMVTVDKDSQQNMIIWDNTQDAFISLYSIFRKTSSGGSFEKIGSINAGEQSFYMDEISDPSLSASTYSISTLDLCGSESDLSLPHTSMHLFITPATSGYHLSWEEYAGFDYDSCTLYRAVSNNPFQLLTTIPAGITSYTDSSPPSGELRYYLQVDNPDGCNTGLPISTRSNIVSSETGFWDHLNDPTHQLIIKPNPNHGDFDLFFTGKPVQHLNIKIFDLQSTCIYESTCKTSSNLSVNVESGIFVPGIYIVWVYNDIISIKNKIVVLR